MNNQPSAGKKVLYFLLCFVPLIMFYIFQAIGLLIAETVYVIIGTPADLMVLNMSGQIVAIIAAFLFYTLILRERKLEAVNAVFSVKSVLLIVIAMPGMVFITNIAMTVVSLLSPGVIEKYEEMIESTGLGELSVLSSIASILLAPIVEELFFRGVTMRIAGMLSKKFWVVNCIQALIFGIAHMNLVQGTYAFLLGVVLGYLVKQYNSLYASMIAHAVFNFCGTYLVTFMGNWLGDDDSVFASDMILIIYGISIAITIAALILIKKDKKSLSRVPMFKQKVLGIYPQGYVQGGYQQGYVQYGYPQDATAQNMNGQPLWQQSPVQENGSKNTSSNYNNNL